MICQKVNWGGGDYVKCFIHDRNQTACFGKSGFYLMGSYCMILNYDLSESKLGGGLC